MEHRLRRKQLQLKFDTNASNETYLKEIQEKRKRRNIFHEETKMEKRREVKNMKAVVTLKWAFPDHLSPLSTEAKKSNFHKRKSSFLQNELLDDVLRLEKEKEKKDEKKKAEKEKRNQRRKGKTKRKWKNKQEKKKNEKTKQ